LFNLDFHGLKNAAGDALLHWHKSIWQNGYTFLTTHVYDTQIGALFDGEIASLLMKEIDLEECKSSTCSIPMISSKSVLVLSMVKSFDRVPIYSVSSKVLQIKRLESLLSKESLGVSEIKKADTLLLGFQIQQFLNYFSIEFDLNKSTESGFDVVMSESRRIIPPSLVNRVLELIDLFAQTRFKSNQEARGLAWIKYGLLFLDCFIPDLSVDPVEMRKAKLSFLTEKMSEVFARQMVEAEFQILKSGTELIVPDEKLGDMLKKEEKWNLKLPYRPENSQMDELYADLSSLKKEVLEGKKIDSVVKALLADDAGIESEEALQQVLSIICQRLERRYPYYLDIIHPVLLAIFQIKFGFRIIQALHSDKKEHPHFNILAQLLNFNANCNLSKYSAFVAKLSVLENPHKKFSVVLAVLKNLTSFRRSGFADERELIIFSGKLFSLLNDYWGKAEAERLRRLEEENTIYKTQSHHILTDEEIDEAEYKKLFPDYAEEFAELDDSIVEEKSHHPDSPLFDTFEVMSLFQELNSESSNFASLWGKSFCYSFDTASSFAYNWKLKFSVELDLIAQNGFIFMSRNRISNTEQDSTPEIYDFYNDSNVFQAAQACSVLYSFDAAIGKALANWPEHAVLLQLSAICRRILSFTASSPVMKFLTGLELLLVKSEDWEKYASREFSLKNEISKLVELIVQWRKLELDSWRDLILIETRKSNHQVSVQWFYLWKIIMGIAEMTVFIT
jgi:midasin